MIPAKSAALVAAVMVAGCGGIAILDQSPETTSGSASASSGNGAQGGSGGSGGGSGGGPIDAGVDAPGPPPIGPVYVTAFAGAAGMVLYTFDPVSDVLSPVGPLPCNGLGVVNIAVSQKGTIYGVSFFERYVIDATTASCTMIGGTGYGNPNSLAFVPAGTVDPNEEALVGYMGSTYVRVDENTGALTTLGDLGAPEFTSTGDLVSIPGGGTSRCTALLATIASCRSTR